VECLLPFVVDSLNFVSPNYLMCSKESLIRLRRTDGFGEST